MKNVYNTGKVSIGSNYHKPQRFDMSRDMELLQTGLLERLNQRKIENRILAGVRLLIILALGAMVGLAVGWMI